MLLLGLPAHSAEQKQYLDTNPTVRALARSFGKKNSEHVKILSGPESVNMLRDKSPGKVWQVSLGETNFKIAIQDVVKIPIANLVSKLERVPPSYRRAFQIVSEDKKDGVAIYANLGGGALAHGSQDYLNMVPGAFVLVLVHESGHILEQRHTRSRPDTIKRWEQAIRNDKISVSQYGDGASHEDLADFAAVYAIYLDAGPQKLAELKALSPERFRLWEEILKPAK
jgi:hypothetical protein